MKLDHGSLSRMLETAIVAARLAGQRAMEEINFIKTSIKNGNELVTQADARCQQIIIDRIKETYPDHGFIAEEGEGGGIFKQQPRGSEQLWWVIDPIDGTNNFAHKIPLFVVSIAAMHEGEPIVGVIFEPATDSMFTAVKDGEAQLNGRRINAGEDTINEFTSIALDSHLGKEVPGWACEIIRRTRARILGVAALEIAYVASGGLIGAIFTQLKLWDLAAGTVIADIAGAVVSDWQGEKLFPVDLENYEGQKLQLLVANKKVHAELAQLIKTK
jgi:myo-inositol-1(or 4)-monophosphatase